MQQYIATTIATINITTSGVEKQLSGLKADKAYGPDGIPPWFLKENAQEISKVLTDIYQDCIDTGTVPIQWKHANVCAIHKKGKKSDPSNYTEARVTYLHRIKGTRTYRTQPCYEASFTIWSAH